MTAVLVVAALAAVGWWVLTSPVRIAATAVAIAIASPVGLVAMVLAAAAVAGVAGGVVWRSLRESGGRLLVVSVSRPAGVTA